ncbi:MAG: PIN domain-containing protein [Dehalococcoidia bacterium]|nr:PIN domain-containing protein [Dehalococcoidia bacterium]
MTVFVDTSAFYACLDADDENYQAAVQTWRELEKVGEAPTTSNYVLVETTAVVGRRLGPPGRARLPDSIRASA